MKNKIGKIFKGVTEEASKSIKTKKDKPNTSVKIMDKIKSEEKPSKETITWWNSRSFECQQTFKKMNGKCTSWLKSGDLKERKPEVGEKEIRKTQAAGPTDADKKTVIAIAKVAKTHKNDETTDKQKEKEKVEKEKRKDMESSILTPKEQMDLAKTTFDKVFTTIDSNEGLGGKIVPAQKDLYHKFADDFMFATNLKQPKRTQAYIQLIDDYKLKIGGKGELQLGVMITGEFKGKHNDSKKGITKSSADKLIDLMAQSGVILSRGDNSTKTPAQELGEIKPNIGTARTAKKDSVVANLFGYGPLEDLKDGFKQVFGPVDPETKQLLNNSNGKNARKYLEHSIKSNDTVDKMIIKAKELEETGKIKPAIRKELENHKKRMDSILKDEKIKVPSKEAEKKVGSSYAQLAQNIFAIDAEVANSVMKQIGEMALYDTEIALGDECYLPAHGSFPSADKLKVKSKEKNKNIVIEKIQGISVKFGLASGKWGFWGFPGEVSKYQLFHPDLRKRDILSSKPGDEGYTIGIKDSYIDDPREFNKLVKESKLDSCFHKPVDKSIKEFHALVSEYKFKVTNIRIKNSKAEAEEILKDLDNEYAIKMHKGNFYDIDKLEASIGYDNADLARRFGPLCMVGVIAFTNVLETSNGLPMLEHNHQDIQNDEHGNPTYINHTENSSVGTKNIKLWKLSERPYGGRTQHIAASANGERKYMGKRPTGGRNKPRWMPDDKNIKDSKIYNILTDKKEIITENIIINSKFKDFLLKK